MSVESAVLGARCWSCVPPRTQFEIQTYILAVISGQSTDPSILVSLSRCLTCLSTQTLYELKSYFLASLAGLSTAPQDMVERSKCFICQVPEGMYLDIQTYALSLDPSGPGVTDPNQLQQLSKDFQGVNPSSLLQIQVYLLATIAGVSTDPTALAALVKCYVCIPHNIITAAAAQALDYAEIETGGGIIPTPPPTCVDIPAQQIPVISGIYTDGALTGLSILLPQVCCSPQSVTIYEADDAIGTGAVAIASAPIADSHAGEINYVLPDYTFGAPPAKLWILVTQTCDGGTESGYSNAVEVDGTCDVASTGIWVSGAGDPDANGFYVFNQAYWVLSGTITYDKADTGWIIEFTGGGSGVEAYMKDAATAEKYELPIGQCFPCGEWIQYSGPNPGDLPAPSARFLTESEIDSLTWADRVVTNGGARPADATIAAARVFLDALDAAGIRTKMMEINIIAPDNLTAAITPLLKAFAVDPWENNGPFVAGDLTVNGLKGDGATKFLDTKVNPQTAGWPSDNIGMTYYLYEQADGLAGEFGGATGTFNRSHCLQNFGGDSYAMNSVPDNGGIGPIANPNWNGYLSSNRTASNAHSLYKANSVTAHVSIGSSVAAHTDNRATSVYTLSAFGIRNGLAAMWGRTSRRMSFFAIHLGLTSTESANFYSAIQALRTTLGGGYV